MSVGHIYMHSLFPRPKLPSIPSDFDYALQEFPPQLCGPEQPQASGSNVTLSDQPPQSIPTSRDPSQSFMDPQFILHDEQDEVDRGVDPDHIDHDYFDDMDDREVLSHEEMYGEFQ